MLTLFALGLIKPSTQGVNVNPVPKGLMLTLCALHYIKPSTQEVNVNPLRTGLN